MVDQAKCRLFKRKDGKYLIYVPLYLVEDSMFPFKPVQQEGNENGGASIKLNIRFESAMMGGKDRIIIEALDEAP